MTVTKADVERWHKQLAQACGIMSAALARAKRSPTMVDDVLDILTEVVDDIKASR